MLLAKLHLAFSFYVKNLFKNLISVFMGKSSHLLSRLLFNVQRVLKVKFPMCTALSNDN